MKTKRTYLVRKNVNENFGPENWYIFTETEFIDFKKTEEFRKCTRYFAQVDACEGGGDTIIAECERSKALEIERERARAKYNRKVQKSSGIKVISYEEYICSTDPDYNYQNDQDLFVDYSMDVEPIVLEKERNQELRDEVARLSPVKANIIKSMYLEEDPATEMECSIMLRKSRSAVHLHKDTALKTIRSNLTEKGGEWNE